MSDNAVYSTTAVVFTGWGQFAIYLDNDYITAVGCAGVVALSLIGVFKTSAHSSHETSEEPKTLNIEELASTAAVSLYNPAP